MTELKFAVDSKNFGADFRETPSGPWPLHTREIWWLRADDGTPCCERGHLSKGEAIAHQLALAKGEDLPAYLEYDNMPVRWK